MKEKDELIRKSDVYEMLHSLGGCDADNQYDRGWDDAVSNAIEELNLIHGKKITRKQITQKVIRMYEKHWNCLPWIVCGATIMIRGDIGRFEYGLAWLAIVLFLWIHPTVPLRKLEGKKNAHTDN